MSTTSIYAQPREHRASAAVARFAKEFSTVENVARYQGLSNPYPITGTSVSYVNQLQINGFIATKTALLLKNNFHDIPFTRELLLNVLDQMQNTHLIGGNCRVYLNAKLDRSEFADVLEHLYIIMLYSQTRAAHDVLLNGPKTFEEVSVYSDKLIRRSQDAIAKEKRSLEQDTRVRFLHSWLIHLSTYAPNDQAFQEKIETLYHDLKKQPANLKPRLLELIAEVKAFSSPIESICFSELFEAVSTFSEEEVLDKLYLQLKTDDYYKRCVSRVQHLKKALSTASSDELNAISNRINCIYNGCIQLLKDRKNFSYVSPTRFAANVGKMRAEWQEINQIFNRQRQAFHHEFCGCQAKTPAQPPLLAEWPFTSNTLIPVNELPPRSNKDLNATGILHSYRGNQHQTVAVIGCEWGGGHREVSRGIANMLNQAGYHPVTVNLPDVLIEHDPVRNFCLTKWMKANWSIASLFNGLLSHKAYALINVLRSAGGGQPDPTTEDHKLRLVLQHLLKINPSSVVTTYSADNELIIKACKMLGIPCIHIATDIDTTIETRTTAPDFNHFYMGIPFDQEESVQPILTTTTEKQRVVTGPPVRHEFTLPRTEESVLALKDKWHIPRNKKVIVISNGKNGSASPFPKLLAERYRNTPKDDIPVHIVVLTGQGNTSFKNDLDRNIAPRTNLDITTLDFANPQQMEELMAMASYGGGLIGKTGGGTLFEAITRGTRLLCDNLEPSCFSGGITHFCISIIEKIARLLGYPHQMTWERINTDFGKKHGIVIDSVDNQEDFIPLFDRMITNDGQPVPRNRLDVLNVEEQMSQLLFRAHNKASDDFEAYKARREHSDL